MTISFSIPADISAITTQDIMEQNQEELLTDLSTVAALNQVLQEISQDIDQWLDHSITSNDIK